jgi:hypothetical protein
LTNNRTANQYSLREIGGRTVNPPDKQPLQIFIILQVGTRSSQNGANGGLADGQGSA